MLPLSLRAKAILRELRSKHADSHKPISGPVFDTSVNAVICVWKRVLQTTAQKDPEFLTLRWHDLRHEAASRLFEKGLHPMEVASITGHRSMQMLKRYTHFVVVNQSRTLS